MWLYKVFLIEKEKIFKRQHLQQLPTPPVCLISSVSPLPNPTLTPCNPFLPLKRQNKRKNKIRISFLVSVGLMIDASSVGMFELYCKVQKTDLFFITKWRKRQKNTHTHELTFPLLLVLVTLTMCRIVSSLEESKVTDGSSPPAFSLCVCNLILVVAQTHH